MSEARRRRARRTHGPRGLFPEFLFFSSSPPRDSGRRRHAGFVSGQKVCEELGREMVKQFDRASAVRRLPVGVWGADR